METARHHTSQCHDGGGQYGEMRLKYRRTCNIESLVKQISYMQTLPSFLRVHRTPDPVKESKSTIPCRIVTRRKDLLEVDKKEYYELYKAFCDEPSKPSPSYSSCLSPPPRSSSSSSSSPR